MHKPTGMLLVALAGALAAPGALAESSCESTGTYRGTFDGDARGPITLVVMPGGNAEAVADGGIELTGTRQVAPGLTSISGGAGSGASFEVEFAAPGSLSGVWSTGGASGTISASRIGGAADPKGRLTAEVGGDAEGFVSMDLTAGGGITGVVLAANGAPIDTVSGSFSNGTLAATTDTLGASINGTIDGASGGFDGTWSLGSSGGTVTGAGCAIDDASDPATGPVGDDDIIAGSGSAAECFNPDFLAPGAVNIRKRRRTFAGTGDEQTIDTQRTVMGTATFNGETLIELDGRVETTAGGTTQSATTTEYLELDTNTPQYRLHGTRGMGAAEGVMTNVTQTFDPPRSDRFDLDPGESYTETYDIVAETDIDTGIDSPITTTTTTQIEKTRTYFGQETITVPAGTFDACKFRDDDTVTLPTGAIEQTSTKRWFDVDTGLVLRTELEGISTTVLLSGSQNGQPLE